MSRMNGRKEIVVNRTGGGAIASTISNKQKLERLVLTCMLWEDNAYEDGVSIAEAIAKVVPTINPEYVAALAIKARNENLRHIPLYLVSLLLKHPAIQHYPGLIKNTLFEVIQRADEIAEFIAIYWRDGKVPLAAQVKKGLAKAFSKFDEYQLAKYEGSNKQISLRDVMFLVHAKPAKHKANLYSRLANKTLATPDTWEVALSAGNNPKETFIRLMAESKLGGLAFLRNLRNMQQAGVPTAIIQDYANNIKTDKILPFRFISALRQVPEYRPILESLLLSSFKNVPKIKGRTVLIVDVSGSMRSTLSDKSNVTRLDTAKALAVLAKDMFEDLEIYATAGSDSKRIHATEVVRSDRGFAVYDAISEAYDQLGRGGIFLKQVMDYTSAIESKNSSTVERVIVLTDEQDCDTKCNPATANAFGQKNYIINMASHSNGIAYGKFTHITGWSESVFDFIRAYENIT